MANRLILLAALLVGLLGLATLLLAVFLQPFRSLIMRLPGLVGVVLVFVSLFAAVVGVMIFSGQPWPDATSLIEYSLWFAVLAGGGVGFNLVWWLARHKSDSFSGWVGLSGTLVGLIALALTAWPAVETNFSAIPNMEAEMQRALGRDYMRQIATAKENMLPNTFNLADYWRGNDFNSANFKYDPDVTYRKLGTTQLNLDVYYPPTANAAASFPALLVLHGGGFQIGDKAEIAEFNQYLASRGWVVFAANYRLAPQNPFPAAQEDVQCALMFIAKNGAKYGVDANRLAVMGRSAGGTLALHAAYNPAIFPGTSDCGQQLPAVQAVVAYYPPTDLKEWLLKDTSGRANTIVTDYLGGTLTQKPEAYNQASPVSYLAAKLPPTLLVEAGRDQYSLNVQTRLLADKLKANNNQVVHLYAPSAGHAFDLIFTGLNNRPVLYYTERFLAYTLQKV